MSTLIWRVDEHTHVDGDEYPHACDRRMSTHLEDGWAYSIVWNFKINITFSSYCSFLFIFVRKVMRYFWGKTFNVFQEFTSTNVNEIGTSTSALSWRVLWCVIIQMCYFYLIYLLSIIRPFLNNLLPSNSWILPSQQMKLLLPHILSGRRYTIYSF